MARIRIVEDQVYFDQNDGECFPCSFDELADAVPGFAMPVDTSRIEYGGGLPTTRIDSKGDQRLGPAKEEWPEADKLIADMTEIISNIQKNRGTVKP